MRRFTLLLLAQVVQQVIARGSSMLRVDPLHLREPAQGVAHVRQIDPAAPVVVGKMTDLFAIGSRLDRSKRRVR
jgi:hypothetical protein